MINDRLPDEYGMQPRRASSIRNRIWLVMLGLLAGAVITVFLIRWSNHRSRYILDAAAKHRIEREVAELLTANDKSKYLRSVFEADQAVRVGEQEALGLAGYDSPEHKAAWKAINDTDKVNGYRMDLYLSAFGYPSDTSWGTLAIHAPWAVLHHSSWDERRARWIPELLEAYRKGILDGGAMAMFLERSYLDIHGVAFDSSGLQDDEAIDRLVKALSADGL